MKLDHIKGVRKPKLPPATDAEIIAVVERFIQPPDKTIEEVRALPQYRFIKDIALFMYRAGEKGARIQHLIKA